MWRCVMTVRCGAVDCRACLPGRPRRTGRSRFTGGPISVTGSRRATDAARRERGSSRRRMSSSSPRSGFDHIRLPVDEEQLWDEAGKKEPEAFKLLHNAIDWCQKKNLRVDRRSAHPALAPFQRDGKAPLDRSEGPGEVLRPVAGPLGRVEEVPGLARGVRADERAGGRQRRGLEQARREPGPPDPPGRAAPQDRHRLEQVAIRRTRSTSSASRRATGTSS